MRQKLVALLLLACAYALELLDTSGNPLQRMSPSLYDSNNVGIVIAPGVTETLYPYAARTQKGSYRDRWFPVGSSRETQAVIEPGQNGTIIGNTEFPGRYELVWRTAGGEEHLLLVDLTCSDGIHCNGEERLIRGECVSGYRPYAFGDNEVHDCYEGAPWVNPEDPNRQHDCGPICVPQCNQGRKCGSGGCPVCRNGEIDNPPGCTLNADFCGSCNSAANETCVEGQCIVAPPASNSPGTCNNPFPLFSNAKADFILPDGTVYAPANGILVPASGILGRLEVTAVSDAENNLQPYCNSVSNSPEFVFEFELAEEHGFEIQMTGTEGVDIYNGYTGTMDSLVAVHKSNADGCDILEPPTGADYYCSDDATPPGSLGSRITGLLAPGRYSLVASTYAGSAWAPFRLYIKFAALAVRPVCTSSFCGADSAGGICGLTSYYGVADCANSGDTCLQGRCSNCNATFIASSAYQSTCQGKQCGFDQCNLPCGKTGSCPNKRECDELSKQCKPFTPCDPFAPDCSGEQNGRGPEKYCGTDCKWHRVGDRLPDLMAPQEEEIKSSIVFGVKDFRTSDCGVQERTINPGDAEDGETFTRRLMFFDTNAHNLGESFIPPSFDKAPEIFEYGACHGHMHFSNFARFVLLFPNGTRASDEALTKLAYCMEDSEPYLKGDNIPCVGTRTCDAQGLTRGYSDYYPADLDGQWIDLDNPDYPITMGWYRYVVEVNFGRVIHEREFVNNLIEIWVFTNRDLVGNTRLSYLDVLHLSNGCAQLPAGVQVPECP